MRMGTSNPIAWLSAHDAQRDVIDGLARFTTWESLWTECPRGDWLLGIAERTLYRKLQEWKKETEKKG